MAINFLSDEEKRLLQDLLSQFNRAPKSSANRPATLEHFVEHPAAQTYVARVPSLGIGGRVDRIPGNAICQVYQLIEGDSTLLSPLDYEVTVFNPASCKIEGDEWVVITCDKGGVWWVTAALLDCTVPDAVEPEDTGTGTGTEEASEETGTSTSTSTATGTSTTTPGTGTGVDCDPITLQETDIACEDGILNVYTRTITLNVNSSGCLTKTVGAWTLRGAEGCCNCGEAGTGSAGTGSAGTGTGTSTSTSTGGGDGTGTSTSDYIPTGCGGGVPVKPNLVLTFSGGEDDCVCADAAEIELTYSLGDNKWHGSGLVCGSTLTCEYYCYDDPSWALDMHGPDGDTGTSNTPSSYEPFDWSTPASLDDTGNCVGNVICHVTEA